jgi:hypothetical protein
LTEMFNYVNLSPWEGRVRVTDGGLEEEKGA